MTPNWANGLYISPVMGFDTGSAIEGAQPGTQQAGRYCFWNRYYDVQLGVWTSTDPITDGWKHLQIYTDSRPLQSTDPSGLETINYESKHTKFKVSYDGCVEKAKKTIGVRLKQVADLLYNLKANVEHATKSTYKKYEKNNEPFRKKNKKYRKWIKKWFRAVYEDGYALIRDNLEETYKPFSKDPPETTIEITCECDCDYEAQVRGINGWDNTIYICWERLKRNNAKNFASDLFHELTHSFGGTEDHYYWASVWKKWYTDIDDLSGSVIDPEDADSGKLANNAATYQQLFESLWDEYYDTHGDEIEGPAISPR